ncbi:MAG: DUF456 family protein [Phycisphaerales bacterium]
MTHFLMATVFTLFGAGCVLLVLVGLPGGWLMLGTAVAVELLDHHVQGVPHVTFGWGWLMAVGVVLAMGEFAEFVGGAAGARAGGASARGVFGALVGGFIGAVVGTLVFAGPLVSTLAGARIGAGVGAAVGELTRPGMTVRRSIKPIAGAVVGRLLGTMLKLPFAIIAWLALSVLAYLR